KGGEGGRQVDDGLLDTNIRSRSLAAPVPPWMAATGATERSTLFGIVNSGAGKPVARSRGMSTPERGSASGISAGRPNFEPAVFIWMYRRKLAAVRNTRSVARIGTSPFESTFSTSTREAAATLAIQRGISNAGKSSVTMRHAFDAI